MQLPPDDLGNGAPIALVERIQGSEEKVPSLRFVSQVHISLKHEVNKPDIDRHSHIFTTISSIVSPGAGYLWLFCFGTLSMAF
jgi:hypothetical protein